MLDLTSLLSNTVMMAGIDDSAMEEFLDDQVKVSDGKVEINGRDVVVFGEESSFDTDTIKIIYDNQEYNINIDG